MGGENFGGNKASDNRVKTRDGDIQSGYLLEKIKEGQNVYFTTQKTDTGEAVVINAGVSADAIKSVIEAGNNINVDNTQANKSIISAPNVGKIKFNDFFYLLVNGFGISFIQQGNWLRVDLNVVGENGIRIYTDLNGTKITNDHDGQVKVGDTYGLLADKLEFDPTFDADIVDDVLTVTNKRADITPCNLATYEATEEDGYLTWIGFDLQTPTNTFYNIVENYPDKSLTAVAFRGTMNCYNGNNEKGNCIIAIYYCYHADNDVSVDENYRLKLKLLVNGGILYETDSDFNLTFITGADGTKVGMKKIEIDVNDNTISSEFITAIGIIGAESAHGTAGQLEILGVDYIHGYHKWTI